jgi:N-terminal half of MaoC dehydratase
VPLELPPGLLGREFDRAEHGPVTAEELIAFARAVGATDPRYLEPGPDLVAHPTFCVQFRGAKFYPDNLPREIDFRRGFDAGKDLELGVPVRPGDTLTVCCTVHDVYEKTGRSGSMFFVVTRFTLTNQRSETVAVIDNRFMHR